MERVATLGQQTFILGNILDAQARMFATQSQISTGKRSQLHTEIARDTTRLLDFKTSQSKTEQFIANNTRVAARLERMDSALSGMFDAVSRLRDLLIQRQSSATGGAGALDVEGQHLLDTAAGLLNVREDGRFLFSGSLTDVAAVTNPVPDPAVFGVPDATYYQGDSVRLAVRADLDFTLSYGIEGNRLGFKQMIGAFKAAIKGDQTNDLSLIGKALDLANGALTELANYRNEVGSSLKILDEVNTRHQDFRLFLENQIGSIEDVDVTEATIQLSNDQTILQASYMTLAQLSRLTLVDFLR